MAIHRSRLPAGRREISSFSYLNVVLLEHGKVQTYLIDYSNAPSQPDSDTLAMLVPMNDLKAMAVGKLVRQCRHHHA